MVDVVKKLQLLAAVAVVAFGFWLLEPPPPPAEAQTPAGPLVARNNLSDLGNKTAALGNLGLGPPMPATVGGLGVISPTAHGVLIGEGAGAVVSLPGGTNNCLSGRGGADPVWVPACGLINVQVFFSSATYTATVGTNRILVTVVGGGGGGAGVPATSGTQDAIGGGGDSGAWAKVMLTSGFTPTTVTIGGSAAGGSAGQNNGNTGNASSFGSLISCGGGAPGQSGAAYTALNTFGMVGQVTGPPGLCTVAAGTTFINVNGTVGAPGFSLSNGPLYSGAGASTPFGVGAPGVFNGPNGGFAGVGAGCGGSGAGAFNAGAQSGGAGCAGIVIVEEYS